MLRSFFHGFKVPYKMYWDLAYEGVMEAQANSARLQTDYWLQYTVGRWYWWFLVFWAVIPLWIWWRYTQRNRFLEVSFFGLLVSLSAGILDCIGVQLQLWVYPYKVLPALPNFFPIDYVVVPVVFMLLYQKYPAWKGFLLASTITASVLSLLFDPLMVMLNLYQPLGWQYYCSIPVFVLMVGFCRWVTMLIVRQDRSAEAGRGSARHG